MVATYNEDGSVNVMNAAWGAMVERDIVALNLSEGHKTVQIIEYQGGEYGCGVIGRVVNVTADERVMADGKVDISRVDAIAFDPYTHGYYRVTERVGEAFKDGLKLKK